MKRLLALIVLLLPSLATAETVIIRGGEHPGFTRLVVQAEARLGWAVIPIPGGWDIQLGLGDARFDPTQAWRLIQRNRVLNLETVAGGTLRVSSLCDCHIRRWRFNGRPVIDIHDGPARPDRGDIARHPDTKFPKLAAPLLPDEVLADLPAPRPLSPQDDALARAVDRAARGDDKRQPASPTTVAELAEARRRADELEASLRGALDQKDEPKSASETVGYGVSPKGASEVYAPLPEPSHLPGRPLHGVTADGIACPDPSPVDPALWQPSRPVLPDFANQTGLFGEFDQPDDRAILLAVQHALYFGFGAEGEELLSLFHSLPPEAPALAEIARILDADPNLPSPEGQTFARWRSCPNILALWSALSGAPPTQGEPIDSEAILLAFQSLPPHLRTLLGPRLITIFLDLEAPETAERLRRLMQLDDNLSPEAQLASARVDGALGAADESRAQIQQAIEGSPSAAAELLLEQAIQQLALGESLTQEQAEGLEALAFEYRLQPLGPKLQMALVDQEILSGQFLAARSRLEDKLSAQDRSDRYRSLYLEAARLADPATFLRLTLPEPRVLGHSPQDTPARESISERLISLGFPAEALKILVPPYTARGRLIIAEAQLAIGNPGETLDLLVQEESPEALVLKAKAQVSSGRHDLAQQLFRQAGLEEEAQKLAPLTQSWSEASGSVALIAAAQILAAPPPTLSDEPYERARQLLSWAEQEREGLGLLTAEAQAPPSN